MNQEDIYYDFNGEKGIRLEAVNACLDYPNPLNLLTLEQAKDTPIDIVICTVHENEFYFAKLKEFYPNAKFIRQVGNQLDTNVNEKLYPNLLASATAPYEKFSKNKVLYKQEFDLNLFKYRPLYNFNNIYSFQNDLEEDEDAWDMWLYLKHNLTHPKDATPHFNFKSYGVGNHDGKIFPKRRLVEEMLDSTFIFQRKFAEGFGHVVHNAFALGRIMVLNPKTYLQGIAKDLLEDEKTCIFIPNDNWKENNMGKLINKIIHWSHPERATWLGENARNRFLEMIDFNREYKEKLEPFFSNLI